MVLIYVLVVLSSLLTIVDDGSPVRRIADRLSLLIGIFAAVFLFQSTRDLNFIYSDLRTYYGYFSTMHVWSFETFLASHPFEFIYDLSTFGLAKLDQYLNLGMTAHDFVMTYEILSLFIVYFAATKIFNKRQSVTVALIYMVYQYQEIFAYNLLRQSIALAVSLLAIVFYSNKHYWTVFLFFLFATQIHSSMMLIVVIPMLLISFEQFKSNIQWMSAFWWFVLLISIFGSVTKLNRILSYLPINLVQTYQSGEVSNMALTAGDNTDSLKYLVMSIGIVLLVVILKNLSNANLEIFVLYRLIFLVAIAYQMMSFIPFTYRILFSGFYFVPLLVSSVIFRSNKKYLIILFTLVIIISGIAASPFNTLSF